MLSRPLPLCTGGPTGARGGAVSGGSSRGPAPAPAGTGTPATGGGGGGGGGGGKKRGRTAAAGAAGGRGGDDDDDSRDSEVTKLCFVDADGGKCVAALPEPKGMPLPLLEPKNGAQLLRKAVGPVLEAVLAHVNKGVELAQQMSLLDMSNKVMGTRQVSIDGTHLHM